MNILKCEKRGQDGWKCGKDGICHIGIEGKQRAYKDQKKIKAKEWEKNPRPLPAKFTEEQESN